MKKLLLSTAAALLLGTAAHAELTTEQIVALFPNAVKIEITRGFTTTKVEALVYDVDTGMGAKVEVVYDNGTDAELSRETYEFALSDSNGDNLIDFNDVIGSFEGSDHSGSGHDGNDDSEDDQGDDDQGDDHDGSDDDQDEGDDHGSDDEGDDHESDDQEEDDN